MKKIFKSAMLFVAASTMAFSLSSCSDSNDDNGGNSNAGAPVMKAIVDNYVDNIVEPTYNNLATNAQTLYDACQNLYAKRKAGSLTQADIDAAQGAYDAAYKWTWSYEIPARKEQSAPRRGGTAANTYWSQFGNL